MQKNASYLARFGSFFSIALLPWSSILLELDYHQALKPLKDGRKIEVAVGKDCANPFRRYTATVARTKTARSKGLSGRKKPLSENEAMLFIFDPPERVTFWMRNTHIPLDLALFNQKGRLTDVRHMAVEPDPTDPKRTYNSSKKILFALEAPFDSLKPVEKESVLMCLDSNALASPKKASAKESPDPH